MKVASKVVTRLVSHAAEHTATDPSMITVPPSRLHGRFVITTKMARVAEGAHAGGRARREEEGERGRRQQSGGEARGGRGVAEKSRQGSMHGPRYTGDGAGRGQAMR